MDPDFLSQLLFRRFIRVKNVLNEILESQIFTLTEGCTDFMIGFDKYIWIVFVTAKCS